MCLVCYVKIIILGGWCEREVEKEAWGGRVRMGRGKGVVHVFNVH